MGQIPIYSSKEHRPCFSGNYNKGLRFERFFLEDKKEENGEKKNSKGEFLSLFKGHCGNSSQLENFSIRQIALAKSLNGNGHVYSLQGHFVTGMGNSHPVENGFLWHYTLGVPYIPGSQVKGIVRELIEQYFDGTEEDKKEILYDWFGSEDKDPKKCNSASKVGSIIFFDAIPVSSPTLGVDIMTSHMGDWYAKGGEIERIENDADKVPADWHDPVPIPFLSVHNAKFLFTIAPRSGSKVNVEEVFACLENALQYLGAGAKTQTGYGYMNIDQEGQKNFATTVEEKKKLQLQKIEQQKQEEAFQESLKGKSDLETAFLKEKKEYEWEVREKGTFINPRQGEEQSDGLRWLEKLEKNPDSAVLTLLKDLMEQLFPGIYSNPRKTTGKKKKLVFKERAIDIIERLKKIEENSAGMGNE